MSGDVIDRAARQVRLDGRDGPVHKMTKNTLMRGTGHQYDTGCNKVLTAFEGAILTTRGVDCGTCLAGGVR